VPLLLRFVFKEEKVTEWESGGKVVKIVYLIFTILLWCAIPIFGLFSLLGFIFFILGLLIFLNGREIKH